MTKDHEIRCSERINHPYKLVRKAISHHSKTVFENATKGGVTGADTIAAELRADIAGIRIARDIAITVTEIDSHAEAPQSSTATRIQLEWEATHLPRLFPLMKAELLIWPLDGTETQIDFAGVYEPPGGALGNAIDAIAGHRIAESTVQQFVKEVAKYLRKALTR